MQVTLIMNSNHQTARNLITRVGNFGSLYTQGEGEEEEEEEEKDRQAATG
jgi:hypothetical protein